MRYDRDLYGPPEYEPPDPQPDDDWEALVSSSDETGDLFPWEHLIGRGEEEDWEPAWLDGLNG